MDIKIETKGGWPVQTEARARKTTRGEGYTCVVAVARVIMTGPDAWQFSRDSSIGSRLGRDKGLEYMPDAMKQWIGLRVEAEITSGGFSSSSQGGQYIIDFGFRLTKRGRGHANFGKQFRGNLTDLGKSGDLEKAALRIVQAEVDRVVRGRSEEAQRLRLASVAAFIVASVRDQADGAIDFRTRLDKLRDERTKKMRELCTAELLEGLAATHSLQLEALQAKVEEHIADPPSPFVLGA
jgi:hypothetical protein